MYLSAFPIMRKLLGKEAVSTETTQFRAIVLFSAAKAAYHSI
jgi:hypothetical protein